MGLSQKITADRVIADQIFIINEVLSCTLPFAASATTISGTLAVTVTELDLTIPGSGPVFVTPTIMYQKELTAAVTAPTFPTPLPATVPLEYKFEIAEPNQFFCGITAATITALGVDPNFVRAEMVRISSVTDAFTITCGSVTPPIVDGTFTESVTSILKVRLVATEDLIVALTTANNRFTLPITASC
ncbi:MAG: hypothetical protein P4N59_07700 [Negativicutes bacterium]|nr:hypothetical protein [Negativicutes bacterium]